MQPNIIKVPGLCKVNGDMLKDLLVFHHVDIYRSAILKEIREKEVVFSVGEEEKILKADLVILSIGYKAAPLEVKTAKRAVYKVGDCIKAGNLLDVIWGAYETMQNLS